MCVGDLANGISRASPSKAAVATSTQAAASSSNSINVVIAAAANISSEQGSGNANPNDTFAMMMNHSACIKAKFLFPICKKLQIQQFLIEFLTRKFKVDKDSSWSGTKIDSKDKSVYTTVESSQDTSRLRMVHRFVFHLILPRLSAADRDALKATAPKKTVVQEYTDWQSKLAASALAAQLEAIRFLRAREILKIQDEKESKATDADPEPEKKKLKGGKGGKRVAATGPTIMSTVTRIEHLGGIDNKGEPKTGSFMAQVLSVEQESKILGDFKPEDESVEESDSESETEAEPPQTGTTVIGGAMHALGIVLGINN